MSSGENEVINLEKERTLTMSNPGNKKHKSSSTSSILALPRKSSSMVFRMNSTSDLIYEKKMSAYLHFLFKINFSNSRCADLSLSNPGKIYKVRIGFGNNSKLVGSLLKRRFWLDV